MWTTRCETRWRTPATGHQVGMAPPGVSPRAGGGRTVPPDWPGGSLMQAVRPGPPLPAVLRLEAEVEAFVLKSEEPQHVFSGDMSSYEVGAAHCAAGHRLHLTRPPGHA